MATEQEIQAAAEWAENNPYEVFGDRDDSLTDEQAENLINGDIESFDESFMDYEMNLFDSFMADEIDKHVREGLSSIGYDDDPDSVDADDFTGGEDEYEQYRDDYEELYEVIRDGFHFDISDVIRTCCNNYDFRKYLVAVLIDRNPNPRADLINDDNGNIVIYGSDAIEDIRNGEGDVSREEYEEFEQYLMFNFGVQGEQFGLEYNDTEAVAVSAPLNMYELYKNYRGELNRVVVKDGTDMCVDPRGGFPSKILELTGITPKTYDAEFFIAAEDDFMEGEVPHNRSTLEVLGTLSES